MYFNVEELEKFVKLFFQGGHTYSFCNICIYSYRAINIPQINEAYIIPERLIWLNLLKLVA